MYRSNYNTYNNRTTKNKKRSIKTIFFILFVVLVGFGVYKFFAPSAVEKAVNNIVFDDSVTEEEKNSIRQSVQDQQIVYKGNINIAVNTTNELSNNQLLLSAFVPVTNIYSPIQQISTQELSNGKVYVHNIADEIVVESFARTLGIDSENIIIYSGDLEDIGTDEIVFISQEQLSKDIKLLSFENNYYLDTFKSGALFREAVLSGDDVVSLSDLSLNSLQGSEQTLKLNMTGVTALTRVMINKLREVGDPLYFSKYIGEYLADADITHVSNEVSFQEGCQVSYTIFCSPPEMIEVLKASGVDLVELTGNHNNDVGSIYNTETINLYTSLGWGVVGGGLNSVEAAKPFIANQKDSNITFLAYNYPDSPNGGAISGADKAGANSFDFARIETEIATAKEQSDFVVVNVQFWECYAYPDGYIEFPECYRPIPNQKEVFRELVDLGADMVVGSSAHQPQTFELYKGNPIYYGLGNLYFDQTQWPGTERGIVLSHYFQEGSLIQTKLAPTVFDKDLQTRLMTNEESVSLLENLNTARELSGLIE
jgi:poly-gamma-glutamate capsule biosynthesis protein CapA/YwtB (metallophosphatase superfamily)